MRGVDSGAYEGGFVWFLTCLTLFCAEGERWGGRVEGRDGDGKREGRGTRDGGGTGR